MYLGSENDNKLHKTTMHQAAPSVCSEQETEEESIVYSLDLRDYDGNFLKSVVWLFQAFPETLLVLDQTCIESYICNRIRNCEAILEEIDCDLSMLGLLCIEGSAKQYERTAYYDELIKKHITSESGYFKNITCNPNDDVAEQQDDEQVMECVRIYAAKRAERDQKDRWGPLLRVHILLNSMDGVLKTCIDNATMDESIAGMHESLILINWSISEVFQKAAIQLEEYLDFSGCYQPNTYVYDIIKEMKNQRVIERTLVEANAPVGDIMQFSKRRCLLQCDGICSCIDFIKVQTVLLTIYESPIYDEEIRSIAKTLLYIFKDMLHDCRILQVVFDPNISEFIQETNRTRMTTKFEMFFQLPNEDIYCLRIDFPHHGHKNVHYNLHEPVAGGDRATGMPLKVEEKRRLIQLCGSQEAYSSLFFDYNRFCWFRNDFLNKLNDVFPPTDDTKNELQKLFSEQCHGRMNVEETLQVDETYDTKPSHVVAFLNSFFEGMAFIEPNNCIVKRTRNIDIGERFELYKLRSFLDNFLYLLLTEYEFAVLDGNSVDDIILKYKAQLQAYLQHLTYYGHLFSGQQIDDMSLLQIVDACITMITSEQ